MGHTVVVADVVVEINLGVLPFTVGTLEAGPEHVVVVNTDGTLLGGVVEAHCG